MTIKDGKLTLDGALSDGSDEIDPSKVQKLVYGIHKKRDPIVGGNGMEHATAVEIHRIVWWDTSKAEERLAPPAAIWAQCNPLQIVQELEQYGKSNPFEPSFPPFTDGKGIVITTFDQEAAAESKRTREAIQFIGEGAAKGFQADKKADVAQRTADAAKPETEYLLEVGIAIQLGLVAVFPWGLPEKTKFWVVASGSFVLMVLLLRKKDLPMAGEQA
jgi:hypothetical protein